MQTTLSLAEYRVREKLTQQQAAAAIGLCSKGRYSKLESGGGKWPIRLALEVHRWSGGAVPADSLVSADDARLLAYFARTVAASAPAHQA